MENEAAAAIELDETEDRFRLGIRHLLYAVALICSALALKAFYLIFALSILVGWWIIFQFPEKQFLGALCIGCAAAFSVLSLSPSENVRSAATRSVCQNNCRVLFLAIQKYQSIKRTLPADKIVTLPDGRQLRHSWRVLLLPYVEHSDLYSKYDFDEPWNGPNNSKLHNQMPSVFACPCCARKGLATYKLVQGAGTAFDPHKDTNFSDVRDGTGGTIAIVEDNSKPVNWLQPDDSMTPESASELLNSKDMDSIPHFVETPFKKIAQGSVVSLLDGSTQFWMVGSPFEIQPGHFLIDDGKRFDPEFYPTDALPRISEVKYAGYLAFALFVILSILPVKYLYKIKSDLP